ncbi:hypothetical protein [Caulobacter sp. 17J65-9]|uniref:hypothetical protein n=1 Tax=Caulobacter sp. 17J65-9 TaxID=2709382 RepID=UPI0013C6B458|nr:hypothetical protein [Caulobacter sp. 17J65-9]NEX93131.1 hypothetical protein [Caulobacter sp. 17J65-9]
MIRVATVTALALLASACAGPRATSPIAPTPGLDWFFQTDGQTGKLAYGTPETDELLLLLECDKGGKKVLLSRPAPDGTKPEIVASAEGVAPTALPASSVESQTHDGVDLDAELPLNAPLLAGLRKGGWMGVVVGSETRRYAAQPGNTAMDRFMTWCES